MLLAICLAVQPAWARRMGGGKSFGSKPSYSQPSTPPPAQARTQTPPPPPPGTQAGATAQPGQTAPKPSPQAAAPGAAANPGSRGFMGGLGGMLGGLAIGGLLGSLFFGGSHGAAAGQGGWGGPGLLDMILIAGGLYLLYRFIRKRRLAAETGASERSSFMDAGGLGGTSSGVATPTPMQPSAPPPPPTTDAAGLDGFDEVEFLSGSKALYVRLQAAWDKRDLEDIARFAAPAVLAEITAQAESDPGPSTTEILLLEARILEANRKDGEEVVSVLFDAMLREDSAERHSDQVREVWHFARKPGSPPSPWLLEGIQQLA